MIRKAIFLVGVIVTLVLAAGGLQAPAPTGATTATGPDPDPRQLMLTAIARVTPAKSYVVEVAIAAADYYAFQLTYRDCLTDVDRGCTGANVSTGT